LDGRLIKIVDDQRLPALGALFVNDTFHVAVVGVRRIGNPENATAEDIWHLGSNTKAMTAMTIGMLVQDGLLTWTSDIQSLLGGAITVAQDFANVTIGQLSSHTSGISDTPVVNSAAYPAAWEISAPEGRISLSNVTLGSPSNSTRGVYEYANMNYIILGLIIDVITAQQAENVIQSRLWEPLGITTGGWGPCPESSLKSVDNPWPHTIEEDGQPAPLPLGSELRYRDNSPAFHTAGAAHMSLADYGKWLRLHFDANVQRQLNLSSKTIQRLHQVAPGAESNSYTYGGWIRSEEGTAGAYSLAHDGSNTYYYLTAAVDVGGSRAVGAITNVASRNPEGSAFLEATYDVRGGLLSGDLAF
jgi:D-alanyl-D-alanine carboxypeptidase